MNALIAALIVSILWFVLKTILYMNLFSAKIFEKNQRSATVRKWKSESNMMLSIYFLGVLIPSMIFAYVYIFVSPLLPSTLGMKTLYFGLILVGLKIFPRFADMHLMTNYPMHLLVLDFVNGTISSFVIAALFAYML